MQIFKFHKQTIIYVYGVTWEHSLFINLHIDFVYVQVSPGFTVAPSGFMDIKSQNWFPHL